MDLLNCIKEAGIVGCGGAGFPTHVKYAGGPVEYLIINGAECEPLLRTDRYIMKHLGDRVVSAVEAVGEMLGAKECRIALKKTYTEEIKALEKVLKERGSKVKLAKMDSFYPAGDEQTMVYEVTGRIVRRRESLWMWAVWFPMWQRCLVSAMPWKAKALQKNI